MGSRIGSPIGHTVISEASLFSVAVAFKTRPALAPQPVEICKELNFIALQTCGMARLL